MLRWYKTIITILLVMIMTGCKEISIRTKINTDGTVERTYTIESDSESNENIFPYQIDSGWKLEVKKNEDNKKYIHTAKKIYPSLNSLQNDSSLSMIYGRKKVKLEIDKKFRWFYTYYSYREAFHSLTVFNKIPMADFFTDEEIKDIEAGNDTSYLKDKVEEWQQRNFYEVLYEMLYIKAGEFNREELSQSMLKSKKEEIFKEFVNTKNNMNTEEVIKSLKVVFKTDAVNQWRSTIDEFNELIEKELENISGGDKFINDVILPGLVLNTNAKSIEGSKLTWQFAAEMFSMSNYEMYAESRTANEFAFIITAVIFLGILTLLFLPVIRKRKAEKGSMLK